MCTYSWKRALRDFTPAARGWPFDMKADKIMVYHRDLLQQLPLTSKSEAKRYYMLAWVH